MRFVRLVALVCPLFVSFAADAAAETRHAADARRLAERTFPSFLGRSTGTPATLPRGMRIETPLSTTAAKVETATGQPAGVAVFPDPIATNVDGRLRALDLDLVGSGRLRAKRAAVDVRYPRRADGAVTLPDADVSFTAGTARAVPTLADDNELFFPDALAATDYALVPKSDGVEALWQLRSAASPERLRLSFDLPAGAALRPVAGVPGAVEIPGRNVTVSPPSAVDAAGREIDVRTTIEGDEVVYTVAHRVRGVTYPVLLDPSVSEYWSRSVEGEPGGGFQSCGADFGMHSSGAGAWTYAQSIPAGSTAFLPACDMRQFGWGYGLYVLQYANSSYVNGAMGMWYWTAPTDAYISGVYWLGLGHRPGNLATGNTTMFAGIGNVFIGWNAYTEINAGFHMDWYQPTGANHSASQMAMTGLRVNGNGSRSIGAYSRLDGAIVYLYDDYNPTVTLTGLVPGNTGPALNEGPWFDPELTAPRYRFSLSDRGLGVWNWAIVRNDNGAVLAGNQPLPCVGTKVWHCPNSYDTGLLNFNSAGTLPEGVTAVHGVGWDVNERTGTTPTWNMRVDRTAPSIAFSGTAYAGRELLNDSSAGLHVASSDGSAAAPRSGVKTISLYVDDTLVKSTPVQSCPAGNCGAALDFAVSGLAPGSHTIKATATDQVGHTSSSTFTLAYFVSSALYGGANHSVDTTAELNALDAALDDVDSDAAYDAIVENLTTADADRYDAWIDAGDDGAETEDQIDAPDPDPDSGRSDAAALPKALADQVERGELSLDDGVRAASARQQPPIVCNASIRHNVGGVQIIHQEGPDVNMRKVIWTVRHTCIGAAALSFHGNPDLYRGGGTYLLDHGVPYDDLELGSGPDGRVRIVERNSWYELGNRRRTKRVKWLSTITAPPDFQWVSDEPFGKQRGIDQVKSHCSRTTDGSGYPLYLNVLKCTLFSYKFR